MPILVDVASAKPPHTLHQSEAASFARRAFASARDLERWMPIFENTGIATRQVCKPLPWYREPRSLTEKNAAYIDSAAALGVNAARTLLERNGLAPTDIDQIIYVNTTGIATPSMDARLANLLGLRRDVRRTPVWGLGCAGGAAGLSLAYHSLLGHRKERTLLITAEMCSLTFLPEDVSQSNFVATALFGDGCAAALLAGDEADCTGHALLGTQSTLYPDSLNIMGWNVVDHGLQVVFDRRIPQIVEANGAKELDGFLAKHDFVRDDVREWLYHPGGPSVLRAYATAYGVAPEAFRYSRDVLRDHGNMSSTTILYVLERYLDAARARRDKPRAGPAVLSTLGPGFSSETLLMQV